MPAAKPEPAVSNPYELLYALVNKYGPWSVVIVVLSATVWYCALEPMMKKEERLLNLVENNIERNANSAKSNSESLKTVAEATRVIAANDSKMTDFRKEVKADHAETHQEILDTHDDVSKIKENTETMIQNDADRNDSGGI